MGSEDGFGLDKEDRLGAKRTTAEEEAGPEPLDPAFPYRVIAFDLLLSLGS
jgi:hypothetical protein